MRHERWNLASPTHNMPLMVKRLMAVPGVESVQDITNLRSIFGMAYFSMWATEEAAAIIRGWPEIELCERPWTYNHPRKEEA
jgi:hypothetical protein